MSAHVSSCDIRLLNRLVNKRDVLQIADPKQFDAALFVSEANIHAGSVALNLRTESSQMLFATHPIKNAPVTLNGARWHNLRI